MTIFGVAALGAVLVILGLVWIGLPGPDNRLRLDSPYAPVALELGERCNGISCARTITYDDLSGTAAYRAPCRFDLPGNKPAFLDVAAHWARNGKSITLDFSGGGEKDHTLTLDFARDCGVQ